MSSARLNRALLSFSCRHPANPAGRAVRGTRTEEAVMTDATPVRPVLEPAAQAFVEATANPPYLFDLAPAEGRKAVD
ncbi:hypothetical protein ABT156_28230, partial [Streptomyces sp. NPDC001833]